MILTCFVILCSVGLLSAIWARCNSSLMFFLVASAWLAVSPVAPESAYFHMAGLASTLSITFMSFFPSEKAERLVWCALSCVILNAIGFFSYNLGSPVYNYTPFCYMAVYLAAICITLKRSENEDGNGFFGCWRDIVFSNILYWTRGR